MKTRIFLGFLVAALAGLWFFQWNKTASLERRISTLQQEVLSLKSSNAKLRKEAEALRAGPGPRLHDVWVDLDDDAILGDPSAPVTLVAFSEFQCPYCARFHAQTFPRIKREYIEPGKVRFVFRDFPLSFHEHAEKAAEAAECAGDQGMYWEMVDLLFANHSRIAPENLAGYAEELGLYLPDFTFCMESGGNAGEVRKDREAGRRAGVSSTPSFFIGLTRSDGRIHGTLVKGAKPFATFQGIIEQKLTEAGGS